MELTSRSLEVTGCIVALRNKNIVIHATLQWLIQWNWRSHEPLLNLAQSVKTRLKFEMVVG